MDEAETIGYTPAEEVRLEQRERERNIAKRVVAEDEGWWVKKRVVGSEVRNENGRHKSDKEMSRFPYRASVGNDSIQVVNKECCVSRRYRGVLMASEITTDIRR